MKYCYNCNRITPGEPFFCNYCGRSYNVKLCPRMHPNARTAQACSRCGSRDLSQPGPKVPWWVPLLEVALQSIPGVLLAIASFLAVVAVLEALIQNPHVLGALILPLIALGVLWWMWGQIPRWLREAVYRLLKGKREGGDRRSD
jgi:hypothetical protein